MNNIIQICITYKKIIELFLSYPNRKFTINELSKLSGISYATTWRVTQKLDDAGLIFTERIGASVVCTLNKTSPFLSYVKKALELKLTPHEAVLKKFVNEIKKIPNVRQVILFGSVARGDAKLTSDIDIAMIQVKKDKRTDTFVTEIVDKILTRTKMRIVPLVLSLSELKQNRQFSEELKKGRVLYERAKRS